MCSLPLFIRKCPVRCHLRPLAGLTSPGPHPNPLKLHLRSEALQCFNKFCWRFGAMWKFENYWFRWPWGSQLSVLGASVYKMKGSTWAISVDPRSSVILLCSSKYLQSLPVLVFSFSFWFVGVAEYKGRCWELDHVVSHAHSHQLDPH